MAVGATLPLLEGSMTCATVEPPTMRYAFDHLAFPERELFTSTQEVFGQKLEVHVLVDATGTGEATATWAPGEPAPGSVTSTSTWHVKLRSRTAAGGEPTALLAGTLKLRRESGLLHPRFDRPATVPDLARELRRERLEALWNAFNGDGEPLRKQLDFAVLYALESLPNSDAAAPAPKPEF
jgi:hypothetical protein